MPINETFETKAMPGQLTVDEAEGIVECFVAGIGNKDSVGDIVLPGAFNNSLKRRKPRVVWGHDWNQPIGKVLDIYEVGPDDPRLPMKMKSAHIGGLFARVQFNLKSERGREAFANILFFGGDQEWSIGYKTLDAVYDNARQANMLKEVELYEVSPVLHGANQLTATISIKSDNQSDRVDSFRKSKWDTFDYAYASMIQRDHPDIWALGGNIKGNDQWQILSKIHESGGAAKTEDQIKALELREAWIARHEGDHRLPGVVAQMKWLAVGKQGQSAMKQVVHEEIVRRREKKNEKAGEACPVATRDIAVNIKNRQNAIETAAYGPLNPNQPNADFWAAKADRWDVSPAEAKQQRCGNCAAFLQTPRILDCIKSGLGNETGNDAMDVIEAGDLGYCEAFDFKCASARTCDAWIVGGPITQEKGNESEQKNHGYMNEEAMAEMLRNRLGQNEPDQDDDDDVDEVLANASMGRSAVLARALANELRTPVRIRAVTANTVVFDVMDENEEPSIMRASWHAENGQVMIGRPEKVRAEVVYLPENSDEGGQAYMFDEEGKADTGRVPTGSNLIPDAIPQERFTGDVLRGYGPRRGNLERLLRYWRPIMRREGGFRRCLVILADHPELYPLQNLCAWLHHETTGLWPNEGCHHPGMKNCRRKLRGVVNGSLWSDNQFNNRMNRIPKPGGKSADYVIDDEEIQVTDEDLAYANKVMAQFVDAEPEFVKWIMDESNWSHWGEDEQGNEFEHEWVKPDGAPEGIFGKKPGGDCGCGCGGKGAAGSCSPDMPKSIQQSLADLEAKVGRTLNSRNADKISQAISLLTEVIGNEPTVSMQQKDGMPFIAAATEDLFDLRESLDPVLDYYGLDAEVKEDGVLILGLGNEPMNALTAIKSLVGNYSEISPKA